MNKIKIIKHVMQKQLKLSKVPNMDFTTILRHEDLEGY